MLKYLKIYRIKKSSSLIKRSLLILMLVFSLQSCKRWSKSGRASIEQTQIENKNDTTKIIPQITPNVIPEDSDSEIIVPENNIDISPEEASAKEIISRKKSITQMFKELQTGVFMVYAFDDDTDGSQGSGFFINSEGIGITNYHVLEGHKEYSIKTPDGKSYRIIEILESSESDENDYVIFKVESNGTYFKSLPIAVSKAPIGEDVFAIGSPKGLENSLTRGSVSQYRKNNRIQIDATIDHGSSGGPLFSMNGEVIGITSGGLQGSALNFAVDIQVVPYLNYIKKKDGNLALNLSHTSSTGEIINHNYYSVSYSENDEQAEWVSYKITDENINDNIERTNDYRDDPFVRTRSADVSDYRNSGYDKGHLAPARAMSHNITSMSESFYLSNISPQVAAFNRGIWKRLEQKVRYWSFYNDSTFVVTGPILNNPIEKIGYNKVSVPNAFYKTLVGFKDGKIKGIAFIMPNEPSNKSIYSYITSIDYVEKITGIDFYYNLNEQIQNEIEANNDLKKWALK